MSLKNSECLMYKLTSCGKIFVLPCVINRNAAAANSKPVISAWSAVALPRSRIAPPEISCMPQELNARIAHAADALPVLDLAAPSETRMKLPPFCLSPSTPLSNYLQGASTVRPYGLRLQVSCSRPLGRREEVVNAVLVRCIGNWRPVPARVRGRPATPDRGVPRSSPPGTQDPPEKKKRRSAELQLDGRAGGEGGLRAVRRHNYTGHNYIKR